MSTQLDPVTGAPLLTPDLGTIDQLPYKVQPVPLADQTNQPQLGRTYLYPDDVPPVLANINAMNGLHPDQAQTLQTDGSHRLLVASSGGGGGPTAITPTSYISGYGNTLSAVSGKHFGPQRLNRALKLYVFSASVIYGMSPDDGNVEDFVEMGLCDANNVSNFLTLVMISIKHDLTSNGFPIGAHGNDKVLVFPNGLDLTSFFPVGADISFGCGFTNNDFTVAASAVQG